jgi:L-alanine-DL-glutamate epimerase-like enolase superfamily enzyme
MPLSRRSFLGSAGAFAAASTALAPHASAEPARPQPTFEELDRAAAAPILKTDDFKTPVKIESIELLRNGNAFLVRIRSTDGAEGLTVPNDDRMIEGYPVFLNRIIPFFVGKDVRDLENLMWELYRAGDNYKLQGIALWANVMAIETAILDLLGKIAGKSIGELLGTVRRRDIAVYRASGKRGNTPEEEIDYLRELLEETGGKALKFRLGGRMSKNADSLPGRTEALIPLVRKTFGDDVTLYADSNSSYDVANAIRIGKLMEDNGYAFFEEPCRFDHFEDTKAVADALTIPVAGGEQEFSEYGFRWMIGHRGVDIVQPDLHYYGGMLRALRVARMAELAGMPCTAHMSGAGLGFVDVLHFASIVKDPGPHQEYKGAAEVPFICETSDLKPRNGMIRVPSGRGYGVTVDPDFVRKASVVTTS